MGGSPFTISWWQYTTSFQFLYPRILQFGEGNLYTDGWSISEENDGNIYLWINGINISSMPIPAAFTWNHIAISRDGDTFTWFLDGTAVNSTVFSPVIPCDGCLSKFADFNTGGLPILIGGGNDPSTGSFIGKIAGFQISQTVRWPTANAFTPPLNFFTPSSGLELSLYANETEIIDKSDRATMVVNSGATLSAFEPPDPTPSPTPDPTPSPTPGDLPETQSLIDSEWNGWNSNFRIYKEANSSPFDYSNITDIAMAIPLAYRDSENNLIKTKCYMDMSGGWTVEEGGSAIYFELEKFNFFTEVIFPGDCQTAPGPNHPNGYEIPSYYPGMFGVSQVRVEFILWTANAVDITDISGIYERLFLDLNIPPEITSYSIIRGNNTETETNRISFGDTLTVNVSNESATSAVVMSFHVPESNYEGGGNSQNHWCYFIFDPSEEGIFGRTFALPSLEEFLVSCRSEFDGDWIFDVGVERHFSLEFLDLAQNSSSTAYLELNAVDQVDWRLYPTRAWTYPPMWDSTLILDKSEGAPPFDFKRIKHVSLGIPVNYQDSDAVHITTSCYFQIPDEWVSTQGNPTWALNVRLPNFMVLAHEIFPQFCATTHDTDHPNGYDLPAFNYGIFGETETTISIFLWTQNEVQNFTITDGAFEVIPFTLKHPPVIINHSISRGNVIQSDRSLIHSGDTLSMQLANSDMLNSIDFVLNVPEAFYIGDSPDINNYCYLQIDPGSPGSTSFNFLVPSSEEISRLCHLEFTGDWTYDASESRSAYVLAQDFEGNTSSVLDLDLEAAPPAPPAPPAPQVTESSSAPIAFPEPAPIAIPEPAPIATPQLKPSPQTSILLKSKVCTAAGIWVYTNSGILQICDRGKKPILTIKACTGKSSTPTYPWIFKPQRFVPGYTNAKNGLKLFYSIFFYKGLAITGVEKVENTPCSNGSVFIEKKHAKQVYLYALKYKPLIRVRKS